MQEPKKPFGRKNPPSAMIIKVNPQAKKAKLDVEKPSESLKITRTDVGLFMPTSNGDGDKSL